MAEQKPTHTRRLGGSVRAAWLIVLVMMLAAAAWSISSKLMVWGMDKWPAYGLSLMFDLAGLLCAQYARRAIERGTPAGLARLAVLAFVAVSGVLNWSHGREVGGLVGGIGLASISFAVELLFELHRRDVRDEQRADRGLVAERMPHIPLLAWLMFPAPSWRALRAAVRVRLDTLDTVQPPAPAAPVVKQQAPAAPPAPVPVLAPAAAPALPPAIVYQDPRCAVVRPLYDTGTRPVTSVIRAALITAGYGRVSDSTIRGVIRDEIERHEPHLEQLPQTLPMASGQNP